MAQFDTPRRAFIRRSATLAGVVFGVNLAGNTAFAQAKQGPPPLRRMSQSDPVVQKLKESPTGRLASRLHGSAVWDDVQEITDPATSQVGYLVPFQKSDHEGRYLFAGNPMEGKEATAIVLSIKDESNEAVVYTLMTVSGMIVQQARTHNGQVMSSESYPALEAISPDASPSQQSFLDCLRGCVRTLGLTLGTVCVVSCTACGTVPSPYNPGCYACAACIGGGAFFCILNCWTFSL